MLLRRWADADGLLISHRVDNGFVRPQVPHDIVRELNELQLWNSRATVMYGTQSGLGPWVDEWRHRHVHPDDLDRHGTNPNRR
jgi:hypothetical protein